MKLSRLKQEEFFGKGTIYGRLTLTGKNYMAPMYGQIRRVVEADCGCGVRRMYLLNSLRTGETKSCGCFQKERSSESNTTHGLSGHPLYVVYQEMLRRCFVPTNEAYSNYGGRGISVCEEWQEDFVTFYNWAVENGYQTGRSLDRKNNDGNYEPSNCRWETRAVQSRNRRGNRMFTAFGETKCLFDWGKDPRCAVTVWALRSRVDRGNFDDFEKALTTPEQARKDVSRKMKSAKMLEAFGEIKNQSAWLEDERCLVKKDSLVDRLNKGWSAEKAISTPPSKLNVYNKGLL